MRTAKTIFKNSIWLILGEIIGKIAIFFLTVIVARRLGVANFGKYNLALSFVMIFSVINDLGLNIFLFREGARDKNLMSKYIGNIFEMRIILSVLFLGVVYIFTEVFNYPQDIKTLIYLFAVWVCFLNLTYVYRTGFKAMEAMKWDAATNVLDNILRLLITIIVLNIGLSIFGVGMAYLMATFIAFCFSVVLFTRFFEVPNFKIDFTLWSTALKEMRYLALVAILIPLFGKFDSIILSHFKGNEAVGLYGASLKLVWMLIFIPGFITQAGFPKLSQYAFQDKNRFSLLMSYLLKTNLILTFLASLIIFFFAQQIILLVYGIKYLASVKVLQILIWSFPLHGLIGVFIYALNARNKQKINALFIGIAILLNIILAIFFTPKFSYVGVAFSTLVSLFLLCVLLFIYCSKSEYLYLKQLKFTSQDFNMVKRIFF